MSDDGGPAYPQTEKRKLPQGKVERILHPGMTLRDWFAGMALQGMLSSGYESAIEQVSKALGEPASNALASASYGFADAMLKQRKAAG